MVKSKLKMRYKGGATTSNSNNNNRRNNTKKNNNRGLINSIAEAQKMRNSVAPLNGDSDFPTYNNSEKSNGQELDKYGQKIDIHGETPRRSSIVTGAMSSYPGSLGGIGYGYGSRGLLAANISARQLAADPERLIRSIGQDSTKRKEREDKFKLSKKLLVEDEDTAADNTKPLKPVDDLKKEATKKYIQNRGKGNSKKNDMIKAKDMFMEILLRRIVKDGVNKEKVADMFSDIGNIYREIKEYNTAILYFKSALRILMTIARIEISKLALVECYIAEAYFMKNEKIYANKANILLKNNLVILSSDRDMALDEKKSKKIEKFRKLQQKIVSKHGKLLK